MVRVALVNDAAKPEFGGHFEVLMKERRLSLLDRLVIGGGETRFAAGQAVIVQAGLAQRHDPRMPGQVA